MAVNLDNLCYNFWNRGNSQKNTVYKLRMTWNPQY